MTKSQEARERLLVELSESPKLGRDSGNCDVEHTKKVKGIPYDPGLISSSDIEYVLGAAHKYKNKKMYVKRMFRQMERVRSTEEWMLDMQEQLRVMNHIRVDWLLGDPNDVEWDGPKPERFWRRLSTLRVDHPKRYEETGWKKWYDDRRAWVARKSEKGKKAKHERSLARRREIYRRKKLSGGPPKPPGRPARVKIKEGQWVAVEDKYDTGFFSEKIAGSWARHLHGVKKGAYERSEKLLSRLLALDATFGSGRGSRRSCEQEASRLTERWSRGQGE